MKIIDANRWVQCRRPSGCGWYWQKRVIRWHWWQKPRAEYRGAYWEDEEGRPEFSSRPEEGNKRNWIAEADWQDCYADCMRHIQPVQQLDAVLNSKAAR